MGSEIFTGYYDGNLNKINVGDKMRVPLRNNPDSPMVMCTVEVLHKGYHPDIFGFGLYDNTDTLISGMGLASGLFIEPR